MEDAGEEFCLCLPSISSDMFTEYLSTCLTPASETENAEYSETHQLIQHLQWKSKKEEKGSIKPEVKLEVDPGEEAEDVFTEEVGSKVRNLKGKQSESLNGWEGGWGNEDDCEDQYHSFNNDFSDSDRNYEEGEVASKKKKRKTKIKSLPKKTICKQKKDKLKIDMGQTCEKTEIESDREGHSGDLDTDRESEPGDLDSDYIDEEPTKIKTKNKKKNKKLRHPGANEPLEENKIKIGRPKGTGKLAQDLLCTLCGEKFIKGSRKTIIYSYKRHMLKHQVENFTCDCPNAPKLSQKYEAQRVGRDFQAKERHMKVEHMGWIACQQCSLCFETERQATKHTEKHKNSVVCHLCGFSAADKTLLLRHIKCHHEAVPEQCPICGKTCKDKACLASHIKCVHEPATCTICGAVVKRIKIHMEQMHMDDSDKRYSCSDCGKGFMDKYALKKHVINMHTKSQPHQCRYGCDNRYNDVSNRNAHEKRRHGGIFVSQSLPKSQFDSY